MIAGDFITADGTSFFDDDLLLGGCWGKRVVGNRTTTCEKRGRKTKQTNMSSQYHEYKGGHRPEKKANNWRKNEQPLIIF